MKLSSAIFKASLLFFPLVLLSAADPAPLLPADWNPQTAADSVLQRLVNVTPLPVKGTHDAELAIVGRKAYIVAEVNDERAGHGTSSEYVAMSIVDIDTLKLEAFTPFTRAGQVFENETLPPGITFVPRIIEKDSGTLRCYFASHPLKAQAQTWINNTGRTVFNVDVSQDGKTWLRKYRFETADGFTYPTFREYQGSVYLTVTQGRSSGERIMFGKLE